MTKNDTNVAIIGGGAAGIAAGRRLRQANIDCLVIEAPARLAAHELKIRGQTFTAHALTVLDRESDEVLYRFVLEAR